MTLDDETVRIDQHREWQRAFVVAERTHGQVTVGKVGGDRVVDIEARQHRLDRAGLVQRRADNLQAQAAVFVLRTDQIRQLVDAPIGRASCRESGCQYV